MGSHDARAFEVVALAAAFRNPGGRSYIAEFFPQAVVDLYDAVVADAHWRSASTLTMQALAVDLVLMLHPEIAARYQADVDGGRLGFGAGEDDELETAMREVVAALDPAHGRGTDDSLEASVDGDSDGLLGGANPAQEWQPDLPTADFPSDTAEPPSSGLPMAPPAAADPVSAGPPPPGEPAPAPPAEPVPAPPAGDTVQTWLNAELDGDPNRFRVDESRLLSVFFDVARSRHAVAAAPAPVAIPAEDETLDLTVQVASSDFSVPPFPQQLRLKRDGKSMNRAFFEIMPLHAGRSSLSVLVDVKGNFLQRLDMSFDVGGDAAPVVETYGRPAAAAAVLEERVATLQITPVAGGYAIIAPRVSPNPVQIWITPDELEARIEGVRSTLLASVSKEENAFHIDLAAAERDALLRQLAFEGFLLYQAIFAGPNASPELKSIGKWLRESLGAEVATLQVVSIGFPVPWPMMYLADRFDANPLSWDNFIGMRHVVEQIPMARFDAMPPAPTIESTPELSVRVLYNDGIDASMPSHPVAAQRAYWGSRGVTLTEGTRADDLLKVGLAAGATDKVLYLFCHAVAKPKDPADSHLILSGDEAVTLGQLRVFAPAEDLLASHPLVFINACESGELSPNFYDGFVSYFLSKGARGVIGTECKAPGYFASEWAKAFFDELFAGKTLGAVVLELRRRFLAEHNNPYGLLYGVHCDADTVVAPALLPAR